MNYEDLLLWVGKQYYPTVESYIEEAKRYGCCKKVPRSLIFDPAVAKRLEPGKTKVYLAYQESKDLKFIFGYFLLDGIIACEKLKEIRNFYVNNHMVVGVGEVVRRQIPNRLCGEIDPPSIYLVGPDDITVQLGLRRSLTGSKERIHIFKEVVVTSLSHCRSFKFFYFHNTKKEANK